MYQSIKQASKPRSDLHKVQRRTYNVSQSCTYIWGYVTYMYESFTLYLYERTLICPDYIRTYVGTYLGRTP